VKFTLSVIRATLIDLLLQVEAKLRSLRVAPSICFPSYSVLANLRSERDLTLVDVSLPTRSSSDVV
jgi:hypothetical protein